MDRLSYRLSQLSDRERILLALLAAVIVPLALLFLVAVPLLDARADARSAVTQAEDLRDWVAARVADLPPTGLEETAAQDTPPPMGLSTLEQSLVAVGLRESVTELANRESGRLEIAFGPVPFTDLIGWLAQVAPSWGYDVAAFRIERDEPGLARASLVLEPSQ
ncbi:type II secretion system protein GspM [Psychromarinibacter sp. S121]|uniref:type II secretion system protein GspM n=1 Tax=Psychromarinibacter sp. S121 TaxID=3415127 RepID=UPI003C7CDA32